MSFPNWITVSLVFISMHNESHVKHKTVMKTRNSDQMKFIPVQTSCDEYDYSFWPRTINDWNSLSPKIINMTSISNYVSAYVLVLST